MTNAYWAQFSKQELDSMHGIEPEDYEEDEVEVDEDEEEVYRGRGCPGCHGCMDCLGMSWRDFM